MVMSPGRVAEITNGYEQRSNGLFLHHGRGDVGELRIKGPSTLYPQTGQGLELSYDPNPAAPIGYILSYDRDASAYRDLSIAGRNVTLATSGGALTLPAGSVGTSAIAANAAQQLVGQYVNIPSWSTTTTAAWIPTAITCTFTTGGGLLRFEWIVTSYHSAGGSWMLAIGWDGVAQYALNIANMGANFVSTMTGAFYFTLAAGSHSATLFVYLFNAGTLTINQNVQSVLFVTEQKR